MSAARSALGAALLGFAAFVAVAPGAAADAILASSWTEMHASRVRLIAGPATAAPGRSYLAGVELVLAEGWKTYWRMPGDAGVPPNFDWSGSTNVAKIKVLYPAPARLPEASGEAVGYTKAVIFPVQFTARNSKQPVELKLALEFGICREICIPAETTIGLIIPPGKAGPLPAELAAALDRVPRPQAARRGSDPELKRVSMSTAGSARQLAVEARFPLGSKGADLFIEAPDGLFVPLPKRAPDAAGGMVRFTADLAPDLVRDLKGKVLTLTLISDAGASEAQWTQP